MYVLSGGCGTVGDAFVDEIMGIFNCWMVDFDWMTAGEPVSWMMNTAPSPASFCRQAPTLVGVLSSLQETVVIGRPLIPPLALICLISAWDTFIAGTL